MDLVERYFWVMSGVVMSLNVAIWRSRLNEFVASGRVSPREIERFTRGSLIATWVGAGTWGAIERVLAVDMRCLRWFDLSQPGSLMFSAWALGLAVAFLGWLWGSGGELVARAPSAFIRPLSQESEFDSFTVRVVATTLVLVSSIGAFVVGSGMPSSPGCAV